MITAKVKCSSKKEYGEGDGRSATVTFHADYMDGRNKEWAANTPSMTVTATLNGAASDLFGEGKAYTLQFVEEPAEEPAEATSAT